MTGLTRRGLVLGTLALALAPPPVHAATWVEVTGSALIHNAADLDAARRRALADALLSAAFAGGALVQGHSVMAMSRMTSDLLIVRPVARVLGFQMVSQQQSGAQWHVRIRAQVGSPAPGHCTDRRALALTLPPPEIHVSPQAPAWAEALARQVAATLIDLTRHRPEVAEMTLIHGHPGPDPTRDATDWHALTQGSARMPAGGHGLAIRVHIAPEGRALVLRLALHLTGPAQENITRDHVAQIRLPAPSVLGRAAPLAQPDRDRLAHDLGRGAVPALQALLQQAGCQPVRAVLVQDGNGLHAPAGRMHGLTRSALAFTIDRDHSAEMLEVAQLSDRSVRLAPLDPTRPPAAFAGRAVRFMDTGGGLP